MNTGAEQKFLEYGVVGAIALLALAAVVYLFKRQEGRQESALQREIARAAAAEQQLRELNAMIRDQTMAQLVRATDAISRVTDLITDVIAEQRHDDRRGPRR